MLAVVDIAVAGGLKVAAKEDVVGVTNGATGACMDVTGGGLALRFA